MFGREARASDGVGATLEERTAARVAAASVAVARVVVARVAVAAVAVAILAGCAESPAGPGPLDGLPRALSPAERQVVDSGNEFGLDLFARVAADYREENVVFSPLSAYMALGMTANGADGETLAAMRSTLAQSGLEEAEANAAFRDLMELILGLDADVETLLANSIWYRTGFPVRASFADLSRTFFDAEVRALDFSAPGAKDTVNAWVEDATRGRIRDLLSAIRPEEVMFLINAVYFKGAWQEAFDPDDTRNEAFRRLDGTAVNVPMMSRGPSGVRHQSRVEFEAVELLYGRGAFSMVVLLPPEGAAPAGLVQGIDGDTWSGWMDGFAEREVALRLPRFRVEWKDSLNTPLKAMGMAAAFDPTRADFSRLVEEDAVLPGNLYITEVKQKAFIEVNEEGTEAAAATSVGVGVTSAPPTFSADRPFLFAIRERFSGTVLFMGQVLDPTAE